MRLRYRRLTQYEDYQAAEMSLDVKTGLYVAQIPGGFITPEWDLMYYLEALAGDGGSLWPSWEEGPPYVVVTPDRNGQANVAGRTRSSRPND